MPGNVEEKEKCLEKLNQMQKFLPFLDFMIDKIKKKNGEISLECQLSKFQLLRSMIAEKSRKYNWEVIVKVEEVIEKLITKLDYKEQYEKPKENLDKTDSQNTKMTTSVSRVPSSNSNSSNPKPLTTDSKSQDLSPNTVDFIMETLKLSSDDSKITERNTEAFPSGKTVETDLDKDLDGFDLTDCPNATEILEVVPEKSATQDKLLKSQNKPNPTKASTCDKTEKGSELQTVSAFSRSQIKMDERKTKSNCSESSENLNKNIRKSNTPVKTPGRQKSTSVIPCKPLTPSEKSRTDSAGSSGEVTLKQKLKEKLSADICEVYRVPGKCVGGSLRSLKDPKDHKKNSGAEETQQHKSGKSSENEGHKPGSISQSRSSSDKKDSQHHSSRRDSSGSERRRDKSTESESHGRSSIGSGKSDKKCESSSKTGTSHKKETVGDNKKLEKSSKDGKSSLKPENRKSRRSFDVHKLNDEELLNFVKENVKSLPHLAKMKSGELRKVVQSLSGNTTGVDTDEVSEISDDSFKDLDDFVIQKNVTRERSENKTGSKVPRPLKSRSTKVAKLNPKTRNDGKVEVVDLADDLEDVSFDESLDEDEYALKLIEETTIKTYPKKKKESLELPVPTTVDLYEDVSSVDSFELKSKDPRSSSSENKNKPTKPESVPQLPTDKSEKEVLHALCNRPIPSTPNTPKEVSKVINPPVEVPKLRANEERIDPRSNRVVTSHSLQDQSQPPVRMPLLNDPRRYHSYMAQEPKSYAEYKRLKALSQKSLPQNIKAWDTPDVSKPNNPRNLRTYEARKKPPSPKHRNVSNEDWTKKDEDRRNSSDSKELVSPLEELYKNEKKSKTGRGYGLQNFKIPKRAPHHSPRKSSKSDEKQLDSSMQVDPLTENWDAEVDPLTENWDAEVDPLTENWDAEVETAQANARSSKPVDSSDNRNPKVTKNNISSKNSENLESNTKTDEENWDLPETNKTAVIESESVPPKVEPESKSKEKTDNVQASGPKNVEEEGVAIVNEGKAPTENVKKCEAQVVECDSSMETSSLNEQSFGKESASSSDKNTVVPKEEITQEFVEALIRKSFQSGEGKLLLAQVKLFEELARKLNSKKLKTIQKIINSESDSSSSTTEASSEDEKKKKKSKKQKKKKGRKSKKHKSSSSSSSSESEESSDEENYDKKEDGKNGEERLRDESTTEEGKSKNESSTSGKNRNKKRRKNTEFGRNFSGRKAKRKQKQKKLLEKILNEDPKSEANNEGNSGEAMVKESEPKSKPRTKGKCKTELDRLHEDIRSMFISAGVVTATGKRMCRILKQSGGNMNNLDIVKESAKMVEEEKLRKVHTRSTHGNSRAANPGSTESRSRSQSLDKGAKPRETQPEYDDHKLSMEPRVYLQKINLDNFGYGIKISDDCISFRRMQGRNKAIRGEGIPKTNQKMPSIESLSRNVFLARNKRKYERLKDSKCKKGYRGKKLMDIVKNLPLKMAKMKHLQFCENKTDDSKASSSLKSGKKRQRSGIARADFSNIELLQYAFEKKRKVYSCKLCFHVTRNITMHYIAAHPDHEVLISRLSAVEAEKAKQEAKKIGDDITAEEKNSVLGASKRSMKTLISRASPYNCRMCRASNIETVNDFANHVSTHTGEFRFKCPVMECTLQFFSRQDIKFHILTKHTKSRHEFYGKVAEIFPLIVEGNKLWGFLCSLCNFVQMNRQNLEDHMMRQHGSCKTDKIIKINLSSPKTKKVEKRHGNGTGGLKSDDARNEEEESDVSDEEPLKEKISMDEESAPEGKKEREGRKRKLTPEDSKNEEGDLSEKKKLILDRNTEGEVNAKEMAEEGNGNSANSNDTEMEDCVDLKGISTLKGSDIIDSLEKMEGKETFAKGNSEPSGECVNLKVGPLEAQIFKNSEVLYECYVKGCLFSTRLTNLFERHIEISHIQTKWDGVCEICTSRGDDQTSVKKPARLITALRHLKLHEHEEINGESLSPEDLLLRAKLLSHTESTDDPETNNPGESSEVKEKDNSPANPENPENPFPAKPLLRVRNFLGDRLSTPKVGDSEPGKTNEEESPSADASKMFTIENVRSLNNASEESDLKIEKVCSLKDQLPKAAAQLTPGKAIIVRSCPTRKIAIRPENGPISVDGAHVNVVQPPIVGHPVVLSPISGTSPIRIISASLTPTQKFTVKPIMVPADSIRFSSANAVPVIRSAGPSALKTASIIPVTTTVETTTTEGNTQTTPVASTSEPQVSSLTTPTATKNTDGEDAEEKDTIMPQKIPPNLTTGKKSLKDAKIYQEMLTKTKLCHFFKCMGIECSFTCDDENIFMQHIGLHEVQRRMSKNKGVRTMYLKLANRMTKAFYWQQCAYCCEVLNNSIRALSQHIREEHGHCIYQCAFCFYRAVSHSYVKLHQNLAHSQLLKTAPRLIYKCKPLKAAPTLSAALEKHGRRQSVRPYYCDQCGRKFFITEDFISHLASEHQSVTAYTCHICKNLCFKINRLINHYKLHSYSTYQCPYCIHGTETEKEMVFHLCNFHFSQPAVMYVRALAEGHRDDEKQKPNKKKKPLSNQLDSLKVIVYESDNLNLDCIVEVDPDDSGSSTANTSESNVEVTSLAAELGISTEAETSGAVVTPLMKELASIGEKGAKNITVKTLLPNAQFSTEGEKGGENCSVLISSGLSIPTDQNEEREMNIPLGQLPLEAVNVQHKEPVPPPPPPTVESPDRNLKLNELIVNLQQKEKTLALAHSTEEDKIIQPPTVILSSAVHKLPPVVLTRNSSKNLYPSKCMVVKKKPEEPIQKPENEVLRVYQIVNTENRDKAPAQDKAQSDSRSDTDNSKETSSQTAVGVSGADDHPRITNVVSLSTGEFDKEQSESSDIVISDVCSLSASNVTAKDNPGPPGVIINIQTKVNSPAILKPPIIRVEDFPIGESKNPAPSNENPTESKETKKQPQEESKNSGPGSPDVIILEEERTKDIVTVTLDSDDEKEAQTVKKEKEAEEQEVPAGGETIRKEMELLRKQIANETDSLLLDEPESVKPSHNLSLNIKPTENPEEPNDKNVLSPIEEAICSLNKKLQSETEEAQKKDDEEKKEKVEENDESNVQERPRTRFGSREKKREATESDGDEGCKKDDSAKKKFKEELTGKELFICGNEKCSFAADDDSTLKDHLFVCDLSRESSVLVCPHCSRQIKQFHAYLEHLKYHGEKKFHCGLCSFSSAVDQGMSRHVKQKHKCSLIKVLAKESKEGHFLYYPKNYRVEKVDFEVNGYSPGDEDKLPLQSVYQVNVKCAKCPYFTKVRSNMVRHLKIHLKSVETEGSVVVPSTAPTNPVPCLETKERMFDKMTNLAASSQLAQAKERSAVENLSPEEEAKLPQFVPEQMRYKCCLPDCNYITVDDGMLKHHIKALHDEIGYYSCPHCQSTVHVDVRHVILDKIGFHLKHHDAKLYKCPHCIFFHYQKNVVEKHTVDKHPDRRFFIHTVREPKQEGATEEESPNPNVETGARVWKCGLCDSFQTPSKPTLMDHINKTHNTKSKYKCQLCSLKGNAHQVFVSHFASKHPGEKVSYVKVYFSEIVPSNSLESQSGNSSGADSSNEHFDTTPLWQRGAPRIRHIRGILIEEEEIKTKKTKRMSMDESDGDTSDASKVKDDAFYCPLCINKKKPYYTRSEDCFRTHLYQELNYQQYACILCGKMFVDKKDFERHHTRVHPDKDQVLKQTKEDHEIKFWVDQVIEKRRQEMEGRKRKLSDAEDGDSQESTKKIKEA